MAGRHKKPDASGIPTAPDKMSLKDISAIIKLASKQNIAKLTFGGLHIEFRSQCPGDQPNAFLSVGVKPTDPPKEIPEELRNLSDAVRDEFYKAQLLMDDPEAYETLMIDAERERFGQTNDRQKDN